MRDDQATHLGGLVRFCHLDITHLRDLLRKV